MKYLGLVGLMLIFAGCLAAEPVTAVNSAPPGTITEPPMQARPAPQPCRIVQVQRGNGVFQMWQVCCYPRTGCQWTLIS